MRDCVELLGTPSTSSGGRSTPWPRPTTAWRSRTRPGPAAPRRAEDDLHAWLSAALGNQDTCLEGFRGTDDRLLRRVKAAVAQLSQLVSNLLAMHKRLRSITRRTTAWVAAAAPARSCRSG